MLLDVRDLSFTQRFSTLVVPGVVGGVLLLGALAYALWHGLYAPADTTVSFGLQQFSIAFLNEYWLHFELVSVLLVAAVVAAVAVIKVNRGERG
jgi:NADH:ubiquinone oxidoreductase subunit 6 (subunit J)